jgi:hypothetical protein
MRCLQCCGCETSNLVDGRPICVFCEDGERCPCQSIKPRKASVELTAPAVAAKHRSPKPIRVPSRRRPETPAYYPPEQWNTRRFKCECGRKMDTRYRHRRCFVCRENRGQVRTCACGKRLRGDSLGSQCWNCRTGHHSQPKGLCVCGRTLHKSYGHTRCYVCRIPEVSRMKRLRKKAA